jgi:hypothetical protein
LDTATLMAAESFSGLRSAFSNPALRTSRIDTRFVSVRPETCTGGGGE